MKKLFIIALLSVIFPMISNAKLGKVDVRFCDGNKHFSTQDVEPNNDIDLCISARNGDDRDLHVRMYFVDGLYNPNKPNLHSCYSSEAVKRNFAPFSSFNENNANQIEFTLNRGEQTKKYFKVNFPESYAGMSYGCLITETGERAKKKPGFISVQLRRANLIKMKVNGEVRVSMESKGLNIENSHGTLNKVSDGGGLIQANIFQARGDGAMSGLDSKKVDGVIEPDSYKIEEQAFPNFSVLGGAMQTLGSFMSNVDNETISKAALFIDNGVSESMQNIENSDGTVDKTLYHSKDITIAQDQDGNVVVSNLLVNNGNVKLKVNLNNVLSNDNGFKVSREEDVILMPGQERLIKTRIADLPKYKGLFDVNTDISYQPIFDFEIEDESLAKEIKTSYQASIAIFPEDIASKVISLLVIVAGVVSFLFLVAAVRRKRSNSI